MDFIKVYGPLGMGWPVALWLFVKYTKLTDKLLDVISKDTEANVKLAERISGVLNKND